MARAILRTSFDGDSSTTTTGVNKILEDRGFNKIGTGVREAKSLPIDDVLESLIEVCKDIKDGASVDHIWIYVDEPKVQAEGN